MGDIKIFTKMKNETEMGRKTTVWVSQANKKKFIIRTSYSFSLY